LINLKQLGRSRDQKLIKLHCARAVTSARKFDKHGHWHYLPILARGFMGLFLPVERFNKFAMKYWYGIQRSNRDSCKNH